MIGKRIHDLRRERKETQEDIGKLLNVGRSTIAQYERSYIKPPVESIEILANHFDVSVDYMIGKTNFRNETEPTEKHASDVSHVFKLVRDELRNNRNNVLFEGVPIDDRTRALLLSGIEHLLTIGRNPNR